MLMLSYGDRKPALGEMVEHEICDGSILKEESFLVFQRDARTCDVLHALIRLSNRRDREASQEYQVRAAFRTGW